MISIDTKALARLESHRGIGYLLFLAAIFAPGWLYMVLIDQSYMKQSLLLGAMAASAAGLMVTTCATVGVFMIISNPEDSPFRMRRTGAGALAIGASLSLMIQGAYLVGAAAWEYGPTSFRSYFVATFITAIAVMFLLAITFTVERRREQNRLTKLQARVDRMGLIIDAVEAMAMERQVTPELRSAIEKFKQDAVAHK